jgi:hypothetical protein
MGSSRYLEIYRRFEAVNCMIAKQYWGSERQQAQISSKYPLSESFNLHQQLDRQLVVGFLWVPFHRILRPPA